MIIELLIVLVIAIISFCSTVYNIQHRCPPATIKIEYVRAGRLPGLDFEERVGITTINLKLDRDVPCGIYRLNTVFGEATMFVSKNSLRVGYLNYDKKLLESNPETKKEIDSGYINYE